MPTNNIAASGRRALKRQSKLSGGADRDDEDDGAVEFEAPVVSIQPKQTKAPAKQTGGKVAAAANGKAKPTAPATKNSKKQPQVPLAAALKRGPPKAVLDESDSDDSDDDDDDGEEDDNEFGGNDNIDFEEFQDDDDDQGDSEDDIDEQDDFETKARKYKKVLLKEGRIASAEAGEERARLAPITPFADLEAAEGADEDDGRGRIAALAQGLTKPQQSFEELKDRVAETVRVLSQLKDHREDGHSREDYMKLLRADLIELHEYNEFLMDRILELFPPHEAVEFLEAMEKERPVTLRTNTLKTKRRDLVQNLIKRGMSVEPLEKWNKVGLQVFDTKVHPGATLEYLAGHYMVQAAASFLPVMALNPQEGEKILDMAAAPGGKTTYICQLMKNTGIVVANDPSEPRCKSLNANIQRLGITNCVVTNYDGVGYKRVMQRFDRILLDAPCTGTGVISRDKSIKTSKQYEDVQRVSLTQRKLILEAIDCLKPGGVLVYSTCSFLVEEDEAVVDFALKRRFIEVVPTELPFGRPGLTKYRHHRFDPSIENTKRYLPHVHNMDGFYVAKIQKIQDGVKTVENGGLAAEAGAPSRKISPEERKAAKKARQVASAEKAAAEKQASRSDNVVKPNISVPPPTKKDKANAAKKKKRQTAAAIIAAALASAPTPAPTPAPAPVAPASASSPAGKTKVVKSAAAASPVTAVAGKQRPSTAPASDVGSKRKATGNNSDEASPRQSKKARLV